MGTWERELAELVSVRGSALKRYAYLLCGDESEAEELVQEGLLRVFVYRRHDGIGQLENYVRKAILNLFLDRARRRQVWARLRPLMTASGTAEDPMIDVTRRHDVHSALQLLAPRQRACLVLRYYLDLPITTISQRLGSSTGAVKRYLHEGRGRLVEVLEPNDREVQDNGAR